MQIVHDVPTHQFFHSTRVLERAARRQHFSVHPDMNHGVRGIEEATKQIYSLVPWLIGVVVSVFVLLMVLKTAFRFLMPMKQSPQRKSEEGMPTQPLKTDKVASYPYGIRDEFLTPAELSFHHVLRSVLPADATIAMKVRLSDLLFTRQPNSNQGAMNRIHMKHVDFVICETATMKPCLAIELDDATHGRSDRKQRDEFVDEAFKAAGHASSACQSRPWL